MATMRDTVRRSYSPSRTAIRAGPAPPERGPLGMGISPFTLDGPTTSPPPTSVSVLWIDDELEPGDPILRFLALAGISADVARSGTAGIGMAGAGRYDAIILDLRLPDLFGLTVLDRLLARDRRTPVVIVSGYYSEPELEAEAARHGAAGFHPKPLIDTDSFVSLLRSVMRAEPAPPPDTWQMFGMIAASQDMRSVVDWIGRVAPTSLKVLLTGETGTGKEVVARALHSAGVRREAPFVSVNCAAIPESLIESELFGHRKGAFTGAERDRKGLFETADGGTLFLDEIGDLPLAMQGRLLRCLDDGEVRRVGETSARRVDGRVIAATNRDLRREVTNGRFRADLYYRLCVTHCHLPPLRDRPEDIDALVDHWMPALSASGSVPVTGMSAGARDVLRGHDWPGNVRELRHVMERAVVSARGALLTERDVNDALEVTLTTGTPFPPEAPPAQPPLSAEDERLLAAIETHRWNRSAAASSLGISRSTLWRALKRLGVD